MAGAGNCKYSEQHLFCQREEGFACCPAPSLLPLFIKMGWTNYIIIPKLKIAVQVSRWVDDDNEDLYNAIDKLIDHVFNHDLLFESYKDLTLGYLSELIQVYDLARNFEDISINEFFVYWLKKRNIDFEIKTSNEISAEQLRRKGYKVIEMKW